RCTCGRRRHRLLQRGRHAGEGRIQARTNGTDNRNDGNRDASGDQTILDGGRAVVITDETLNRRHSRLLTLVDTTCPAREVCNPLPLKGRCAQRFKFYRIRPYNYLFANELRPLHAAASEKAPASPEPCAKSYRPDAYFSAVDTLVKVVFSREPRPCTT